MTGHPSTESGSAYAFGLQVMPSNTRYPENGAYATRHDVDQGIQDYRHPSDGNGVATSTANAYPTSVILSNGTVAPLTQSSWVQSDTSNVSANAGATLPHPFPCETRRLKPTGLMLHLTMIRRMQEPTSLTQPHMETHRLRPSTLVDQISKHTTQTHWKNGQQTLPRGPGTA